ncbi:MAG TPA: TatD family hydrolase [Gemmatimonadaceae bacterium]|nr:TatD family hydrolase [Gemmatimonadaceae bacterium]
MLTYVDSHAHLADVAFDGIRDAVVARAREAGAAAVVCIGESFAAAEQARTLASAHPDFVAWTSGVHPHDAAAFREADAIPAIRAHLEAGAVAVGECGLDYHYDHAPRASQLAAFRAQLALAVAHDRPVIVHTRDAEDDTRALVEEFGRAGARGVMHCYTGSAALARAALDAGWFISFSGIVTFRSWDRDDVVRLVPDDRILVESDAPYLAPVPHRGKRNEPAYVAVTVAQLAERRMTTPERLGAIAARNARSLFGLALPSPVG